MIENYTLVPAYGRDYINKDDALKDWNDGKDFKISGGGPYCSIRDVEFMKKQGIKEVTFLYDKARMVYKIEL